MDDLYFEEELRSRIKEQKIKISKQLNINDNTEFANPFDPNKETEYNIDDSVKLSPMVESAFQDFDIVLEHYYRMIYGDIDDIYDNFCVPFREEFTDKKLYETFNNTSFSQEELYYIQYINYRYCVSKDINYGAQYAIAEILLRRKIIEKFGKDSLNTFKNIIENAIYNKNPFTYKEMYEHFMRLLSDKPYGENIQEEFEQKIEKDTIHNFNYAINCGGYALKIDVPIFPPHQKSDYANVSAIIDNYPFVRLLGDEPLQDDEYLVIYKTTAHDTHHFIRVDSDGTVREKNGVEEPKIFENWHESFEDAIQAVFAVKKDHKMFGYTVNVNKIQSLDFTGTAEKAIQDRQNSFTYRDKEYYLKKYKDALGVITTHSGEIIAKVLMDDQEYTVDISEANKVQVENIAGSVTPIIQNGKLINLDQFKESKTKNEAESR